MGFLRWHLGRIGAAFEPAAACLVLTGLWACIVPMALHFATRARITAVDGVPTVPGEELLIWTLKYGPPALAAFAPFALAALLAGLRLRTARYVAVLAGPVLFVLCRMRMKLQVPAHAHQPPPAAPSAGVGPPN